MTKQTVKLSELEWLAFTHRWGSSFTVVFKKSASGMETVTTQMVRGGHPIEETEPVFTNNAKHWPAGDTIADMFKTHAETGGLIGVTAGGADKKEAIAEAQIVSTVQSKPVMFRHNDEVYTVKGAQVSLSKIPGFYKQ